MSEDVKPRIGYVEIEDYTDDYSDWTGQITFPNPKGANIYWQNPIVFIELEPTTRLMDEMADALKEQKWHHDDCPAMREQKCDCGAEKVKEVLENYKKFKDGLK